MKKKYIINNKKHNRNNIKSGGNNNYLYPVLVIGLISLVMIGVILFLHSDWFE